jgi:hypothetical protein
MSCSQFQNSSGIIHEPDQFQNHFEIQIKISEDLGWKSK